MTQFAIAISTYDAFEDMALAETVCRVNWGDEEPPYVILGLCKPNTRELVASIPHHAAIDVETPQTPYIKENASRYDVDQRFGSYVRLFHFIVLAGKHCLEKDIDYIIYLNSGSWVFCPPRLTQVAAEMGSAAFALRIGLRSKYFMPDDHFIIVNVRQARKLGVFDRSLEDRCYNPVALPFNGIHSMLNAWINTVPYGKVKAYGNQAGCVNEYGETPGKLSPFVWDPEYKLLHSNPKRAPHVPFLRQRFLEKYCTHGDPRIQAYLQESVCQPEMTYHAEPDPHLTVPETLGTRARRILGSLGAAKLGLLGAANPKRVFADYDYKRVR